MDDSSKGHILWPVLFLILLLMSFCMSAFAAALEEITDRDLDQMKEDHVPEQNGIRRLSDRKNVFEGSAMLVRILTSLAAYFAVSGVSGIQAVLRTLPAGAAVYCFGWALPDMLGQKYHHRLIRWMYPLVYIPSMILFPVSFVLNAFSGLLAQLFHVDPSTLEDEVTEDEIRSMVAEGEEQGVLDEHESEMIRNIFELDDKEAGDIMTHRKHISALDASMTLEEAAAFLSEAHNSRFPVYEKDIDNIIGVIHFRDVFIFHYSGTYSGKKLREIPKLLRSVEFIPETRKISELFRNMQARKTQMAVVVDEYGGTAGLVTMEDILEEIVGNILDEYDPDERYILPDRREGVWHIAGLTPLEDVEQTLHIQFHQEDYDTLNGYLIFRLNHIPAEDEHSVVEEQGWKFEIREVENRVIRWVKVSPV